VVAGGGAEQAHGLFVRVYETLTMHAHERAANSFLRAQAIVKEPVKARTHAKHRSHTHASTPRRHSRPKPAVATTSRASVATVQRTASPSPATNQRASVASASASRSAGTSATSEFGFEGR
jgi:hypothetical protein